jgi:glycosyltransferase involved in cell wall biosynthesis
LHQAAGHAPLERRIRVARAGDRWPACFAELLARRLREPQETAPPAQGAEPLFAILTVAYETDPRYLAELAAAVAAQTFHGYEWLVLDNGCRRPDTLAALEAIAAQGRVRPFRVPENLGIVGGSRYLLERARGRYSVLVDHDDLLYPDALSALARRCSAPDAAEVYFSDEQKISPLGTPAELIWRPEWSRLYATATSPAAHLIALRTERALAAGAFSDEEVQGSADWDALLRVVDGGARPQRVPEVLYGWRMHGESTALQVAAKPYVARSQRAALRASLKRRGLEGLFAPKLARGALGYYHAVRLHQEPRSLALDLVVRGDSAEVLDALRVNLQHAAYPQLEMRVLQLGEAADQAALELAQARARACGATWLRLEDARALGAAVSRVPQGAYAKAIVDCGLRAAVAGWLWDALGTLELDTDTGIVSGPIVDARGAIVSLGYVAGLDGFFGTPRPGALPAEVRGNLAYIRRNVTAVHSGWMLVRAEVFARCGALLSVDDADALHGLEFCLRSRQAGILTGYTPRMKAVRRAPPADPVGSSDTVLRDAIRARYGAGIENDPYYARYLDRDARRYAEVGECCAG